MKRSPRTTHKKVKEGKVGVTFSSEAAAYSIDLHGLRVEEALEKLEIAIDRALLNHLDRLEIIHGIGTGKLRAAVHQYIKDSGIINSHRYDPTRPAITWIYF